MSQLQAPPQTRQHVDRQSQYDARSPQQSQYNAQSPNKFQYDTRSQQQSRYRTQPPQQFQTQQQPAQSGQQGVQSQQGAPAWPVGRRFQTRTPLPDSVQESSIGLLNQCLVDLVAVNMQLKDAHWNVKGVEFYQLHELFEDLVLTLDPHIDAVAERATALGGEALGTPRHVVQHSSVPPLDRTAVDGQSLLASLADTLSVLDATLQQGIETTSEQGDYDTADLLNEVSRDVSKAQWFLEAHLQG